MDSREPYTPFVPPGGIEPLVLDMTLIAASDVTLGEVQEKLAAHQQWLPIDGRSDQTLGELVMENSTGPLRLGYGAWRDLLLGIQFTDGTGTLITVGGRVVKNVAGYDVTKFLVGSHGVFGNPVTVTTRTYRRPTGALLATLEPNIKLLNSLLTTSARPTWSLITKDALTLGYLGDDAAINFFESAVSKLNPVSSRRISVEDDIAFRSENWSGRSDADFSFRASIPPSAITDFFARSSQLTTGHCTADPAFGIIRGGVSADNLDALKSLIQSIGGTIILRDRDGVPQPFEVDRVQQSLVEQIKRSLDPRHTLRALRFKTP